MHSCSENVTLSTLVENLCLTHFVAYMVTTLVGGVAIDGEWLIICHRMGLAGVMSMILLHIY